MAQTTDPNNGRDAHWTCPDCAYTTATLPDAPVSQALLRSCAQAEVDPPGLQRQIAVALRLATRDLHRQHTHRLHGLYAGLPVEGRALLTQQHQEHLVHLETTAPSRLLQALQHRDLLRLYVTLDESSELALVHDLHPVLRPLGMYEACLVEAWTGGRGNYHHWAPDMLTFLLQLADPVRLRAIAPLPLTPPLTLYRGVAGRGRARRIRGLSWTGSLEKAWWFARRYPDLHDPAVYRTCALDAHILAYTNARTEDEYLVTLPARYPVTRLAE